MNDCRFGVSPVNYPDPDPERHLRWPMKLFFVNRDGYNSFVNFEVIKAMRILLLVQCRAFRVMTAMLSTMS